MNRTIPRQVNPWQFFPSGAGWVVASTPVNWLKLAAEYGIEFEEGLDDLDYYFLAALEDPSVGQLWLWSYKRSPEPTTLFHVDSRFSRQEGLAAIHRALGDIDLDWVTPLERYEPPAQTPS